MMSFTAREIWALVHGIGWGGVFLLSYAGGLAGLWLLRYPWVRQAGADRLVKWLSAGTWVMAIGVLAIPFIHVNVRRELACEARYEHHEID